MKRDENWYPRDDDCIDCGMPLIGGAFLRVPGGALCSSCMDLCEEDPADENDASNYGGEDD